VITRSRCDNILHVRDAKKSIRFAVRAFEQPLFSCDGERDCAIMTTGRMEVVQRVMNLLADSPKQQLRSNKVSIEIAIGRVVI